MIRLDSTLLALLPFAWLLANHYPPWVSAWQEGAAMALLLAAMLMASRRATLSPLWALACLLALLSVCAQGLTGVILFAGDVWIVAMYLATFALAVAAGSTLVEAHAPKGPAPRLDLVCCGLVFAALASVGVGLAQWAGVQNLGIFGADLPPGARPYGNLAQPNHWCTAAFMGLGAALVLYESRRINNTMLTTVALILVFGMVASGSRTAWLQMLLLALVVLGLGARTGARTTAVHVVMLLALYALGWLVWPWLNEAAATGSARSIAEQTQVGLRWPLWRAMFEAIGQRPWTGYGWQQMVMAQEAVALDGVLVQRHFEHAHNLLLDLIVWAGIPVGLCIAGLMLAAFAQVWRRATNPRLLGLLIVIGGLGAHAMVEFPAEYAYFLLPTGLMIGAAHASTVGTGVGLSPTQLRSCAAVLAVALLLTSADYIKAEQAYRMLRLESARIGTSQLQSPAPQLWVLTQLEAFQRFARQEASANLSAEQLQFSRNVSRRFAYPPAQFRHAVAAGLNGQPAEASRVLAVLCRMHGPARCDEALIGWRAAQDRHPELHLVRMPISP